MNILIKVTKYCKETNRVYYQELSHSNTKKVTGEDYKLLPDFIKAVESELYGLTIHSTKAPKIKLKAVDGYEKSVDINGCNLAYFCNYSSAYHSEYQLRSNYSNKKLVSFAGNDTNKVVADNLTSYQLNNVSLYRPLFKRLYVQHLNKYPESVRYM
jgi:hypothetical protein